MDSYDKAHYTFGFIIGAIIFIVGLCLPWNFLIVAGGGYVVFLIGWLMSSIKPAIGAYYTVVLGIAATITLLVTKNIEHFLGVFFLIGFLKMHRLWADIEVYDFVYDFVDDRVYEYVNEDSSLLLKGIASLVCVAFYYLLASFGLGAMLSGDSIWVVLIFLPTAFLLYRAIRLSL